MNLRKENVCVFIENETQLEEAKEIILKYKGVIDREYFNNRAKYAHLYSDCTWCTASLTVMQGMEKKQITLSELEEILKNESK